MVLLSLQAFKSRLNNFKKKNGCSLNSVKDTMLKLRQGIWTSLYTNFSVL